MRYLIEKGPFPIILINLDPGEAIITQKGGMAFMSDNIMLKTSSNGVVGAMGRRLTGEAFFQNVYIAKDTAGVIGVGASFPGKIIPFRIDAQNEYILQKKAFLCAQGSVHLHIWMQKRLRSGLFSGEGFVLQKLSGKGLAFAEMDGYVKSFVLAPGQKIIMESGCFAAASTSCKIDIQTTGGIKNALFSGEGLFNTSVEGPGTVWIQSMPIEKLSQILKPYIHMAKAKP